MMILIKTDMMERVLAKRLSAILTGDSGIAYREYPSKINRWIIGEWRFRCNEKGVYVLWETEDNDNELEEKVWQFSDGFLEGLAVTISGLLDVDATVVPREEQGKE